MSVEFRGRAHANSFGSSDLTVPKPSGVEAGDVLAAVVMFDALNGNFLDTAGFTFLGGALSASRSISFYYRIAGSSEPSSYTWQTDTAANHLGVIGAWWDCDPNDPLGQFASFDDGGGDDIHFPFVNADVPDCVVVGGGNIEVTPSFVSSEGGYLVDWDNNTDHTTGMTARALSSTGSTQPPILDLGLSSGVYSYSSCSLILRPFVEPPPASTYQMVA